MELSIKNIAAFWAKYAAPAINIFGPINGICSLKAGDYIAMEAENKLRGQAGAVFKIAVGTYTVMGVGVTNRYTDDYYRDTLTRDVDSCAVGSASRPDRFLDRDTQFLSCVKGVALPAGVSYHTGVYVAEHGTPLYGGLDHVGLGAGVIGWATLK